MNEAVKNAYMQLAPQVSGGLLALEAILEQVYQAGYVKGLEAATERIKTATTEWVKAAKAGERA